MLFDALDLPLINLKPKILMTDGRRNFTYPKYFFTWVFVKIQSLNVKQTLRIPEIINDLKNCEFSCLKYFSSNFRA